MRALLLGACALAMAATSAARAKDLTLAIGDIEAPSFSARAVRAVLAGPQLRELTVDIGRLTVAGRTWQGVKLTCAALEQGRVTITCPRGVLHAPVNMAVSFSYAGRSGAFVVEATPSGDEAWRIAGTLAGERRAFDVTFKNARLEMLAPWLPKNAPTLKGGRISGAGKIADRAINARIEIAGAAFADASGLHAGEKLGGTLEVDGAREGEGWRWQGRVAWRGGDVFWQPLFLSGKGQRLELDASTARGVTQVRSGRLELPDIGTIDFNATWDHSKGALVGLEARGNRLRVAPLYDQVLNPAMQQPTLSDMRAEGEANITVRAAARGVESAEVELNGVSFEDRQRRFAVFGASGRIPWHRDQDTTGEVAFKGAELLKVPIGAATLPLRLRGMRVAIDAARIPVLDGAVTLKGFAAVRVGDEWRWRFSSEIAPLSMEQLTQALLSPVMHGTLSGVIPEVRYRRGTVSVDGTFVMRAFDGVISATGLELNGAFGRTPRLHGDIEMKNLDLELLTRTFDFGTITGRVDASVQGLELVNWEPVRFDARIASSPGRYPRRISQRAVQNISALGGAGAAAAIQRSFLRFFDTFGYDRLGLSCKLENKVCQMDGIERAPQGYVIVKGGGIPAISVIGYNRAVDWLEFVGRLKRITQENVKPVVK
ncbi:MAG: hypothetical protein ACXWUB_09595 [Burkholderiales bacterium]